MSGEFAVAFVDLVNYLVPGVLNLVVFAILFRPHLENLFEKMDNWALLGLGLAGSYVVGLALHRIGAELSFQARS